MDSRLKGVDAKGLREDSAFVLGLFVVGAAGAYGLIGLNWRIAGLAAGVVAVGWASAGYVRSRKPLCIAALGLSLGFSIAEALILTSGWSDEELIDPLVYVGIAGAILGLFVGSVAAMAIAVRHRPGRRFIWPLLAAVLMLVLGSLYVRVGWWEMESECTLEQPGRPAVQNVELSWSWLPPGFTCTFDDGRIKRSLWF